MKRMVAGISAFALSLMASCRSGAEKAVGGAPGAPRAREVWQKVAGKVKEAKPEPQANDALLEWLRKAFDFLFGNWASIGRTLGIVAGLVILAFAVPAIVRRIRARRRRVDSAAGPLPLIISDPDTASAILASRAMEAAGREEWAEALLLLHRSSVARVSEQALLPLVRVRTNREIERAIRRSGGNSRAFASLARRAEAAFFGDSKPGRGEWDEALAEYALAGQREGPR